MCIGNGSDEQDEDDEDEEDVEALENSWLMVGADEDRLRPFFMASSTSESASTSPESPAPEGVSTSILYTVRYAQTTYTKIKMYYSINSLRCFGKKLNELFKHGCSNIGTNTKRVNFFHVLIVFNLKFYFGKI